MVSFGDRVLVQSLPEKPEEKLAELTKGIEFNGKHAKSVKISNPTNKTLTDTFMLLSIFFS